MNRLNIGRWRAFPPILAAWFGLGHPLPLPANYVLYYLLASAFEPPEILNRLSPTAASHTPTTKCMQPQPLALLR